MPYAMEFIVVGPENVPAAMIAALEGDEGARHALTAIGDTLKMIAKRGRTDRPMLCMCLDCDASFSAKRNPIAFGITIPMFPETSDMMVASGICLECFQRSDLKEAIIRSLQNSTVPMQPSEIGR
jgi:hypothetical protein